MKIYFIIFIIMVSCSDVKSTEKYIFGNNRAITKNYYSVSNKKIIFFDGKYIKLIDERINEIYAINEGRNSEILTFNYCEQKNSLLYIVKRRQEKRLEIVKIDLSTMSANSIILLTNNLQFSKYRISPDNEYIITVDIDNGIYIFDSRTGLLLKSYDKNSKYWAYDVFFNKKGDLFIGSQDKKTYMFDLTNMKPISIFQTLSYNKARFLFLTNDSLIAQYDNSGNIHIYNWPKNEHIKYLILGDIIPSIKTNFIDNLGGDTLLITGFQKINIFDLNNDHNIKNINLSDFGVIYSYSFSNTHDSAFILIGTSRFELLKYHLFNDSISNNFFDIIIGQNNSILIEMLNNNDFLYLINGMKIYAPHSFRGYNIYKSVNMDILKSQEITNDTVSFSQCLTNFDQIATFSDNIVSLNNIYDYKIKKEYIFNFPILEMRISENKEYCYLYDKLSSYSKLFRLNKKELLYETTGSWGFYFSPNSNYFFSYYDENQLIEVKTTNGLIDVLTINSTSYGSFFSSDEQFFFNITDINKQIAVIRYDLMFKKAIDTVLINQFGILDWPIYVLEDNIWFSISEDRVGITISDMTNRVNIITIRFDYKCDVKDFRISRDKRYLLVLFNDGTIVLKNINGILSKETYVDNNGLFISPNPATDYIEISTSAVIPAQAGISTDIKIYDVLGVCVLSQGDSRFRGNDRQVSDEGLIRIDVSGLAAGVYFVRVGDKMLKFVKI